MIDKKILLAIGVSSIIALLIYRQLKLVSQLKQEVSNLSQRLSTLENERKLPTEPTIPQNLNIRENMLNNTNPPNLYFQKQHLSVPDLSETLAEIDEYEQEMNNEQPELVTEETSNNVYQKSENDEEPSQEGGEELEVAVEEGKEHQDNNDLEINTAHEQQELQEPESSNQNEPPSIVNNSDDLSFFDESLQSYMKQNSNENQDTNLQKNTSNDEEQVFEGNGEQDDLPTELQNEIDNLVKEDNDFSQEYLTSLSVKELQNIARERNIKIKGKKVELIERITQHVSA